MSHSPTSLSLEDLISAPAKAESLLELLTPDQITAIEQTLGKVKRRRLDKVKTEETKSSFTTTTSVSKNIVSITNVSATTNAASTASTPPPVLKHTTSTNNSSSPNELTTEIKDGVEWVSFVYSHNRTLKRYSIRTDVQSVDPSLVDNKFKSENCVYPRANLPKEEYHGNRWAYETECNDLGWKLAWLNKEEIAGKRGLIQRAVDSYRNRYPSMRSRRVARQEKLLNGTLRKRKHREGEELSLSDASDMASSLSGVTIQSVHHPKTIAIEDANHQRFRIKINVESVDLEEINIEFRKANCPFPRVMSIPKPVVNNTRWLEETMCNELAWKLAWLNPRHLAGKKNMLQRALDIYRSKFMPSLLPRKNSNRVAPIPPPSLTTQNALFKKTNPNAASPAMSNMSGTTESLDFNDCFSLADEETKDDSSMTADATAAMFCDMLLKESVSLFGSEGHFSTSRTNSTSSYSSDSVACTPSPTMPTDTFTADLFEQFMLPADDPFYSMMENNTTASELSKLYNTTTIEDNTFNAGNLLDPLF
ncbi:MAG: hypothetical protein EXX96DRAFT_483033 [Benjaminiella poitrasii]|nr:MAG: hypothetical protein EXX96DRAFT_483033 [Benjaminiella poitrasii]